MAEPDDLVLTILREMRTEAADFRAEVRGEFDIVKARLDAVETKTDGIAVLLASAFGHLNAEISTLKDRVDALDASRR